MEQMDLLLALRARDAALEQVGGNAGTWTDRARSVARRLARERGSVTADEVRLVMEAAEDHPHHFNAYGAVFGKGSGMTWTGRFRRSALVRGHGNLQRVWTVE